MPYHQLSVKILKQRWKLIWRFSSGKSISNSKQMKKIIVLIVIVITVFACSDDNLQVSPSTKLGSDEAITSDADLRLATNGVYDQMTTSTYYGGKYITHGDMLGDDAINPRFASGWLSGYFTYSWSKIATPSAFYNQAYYSIAHINDVLEKAEKLKDTPKKTALIAELKALRAIIHFDVAKLYGPLPVNLGKGNIKDKALCVPIMDKKKDPKDYEGMLRKTVRDVYAFISSELENTLPHLPKGKQNGKLGADGAKAALARTYLYMGEMKKAYKYAKELIDSYQLIPRDEYVNSWMQTYTSEAIFELSVSSDDNLGINSIGYYVLADGTNGYKEIAASFHFEELMRADPSDVRFDLFVHADEGSKGKGYLPTKKYPGRGGDPYVNNIKVYRVSEMYLIAAEAKLKSGENAEAASLLNTLRAERTTTNPNKYTASLSIDDVLYERRLELFCEGHRAWDLHRNQRSIVRWNSLKEKEAGYLDDESDGVIEFNWYKTILPIHESQLLLLPETYRVSQQNPGY